MIRKANKNDTKNILNQIAELIQHVTKASKDVYTSNLEKNSHQNLTKLVNDTINSKKDIIFISEENSSINGFIMGKIIPPYLPYSTIKQIGYVSMCWVDPSCRNQGIGKQLIKKLENWFKKQKLQYIDVNFLVGNSEAEYFWEKMGYKAYRISSRKKLIWQPYCLRLK